jgi:hypothetical protein
LWSHGDDYISILFSHTQRLAQGEENYEYYVLCYFQTFSLNLFVSHGLIVRSRFSQYADL